jgi:hypothetical protein
MQLIKAAVGRWRRDKDVSVATSKHAAIEELLEAMFSMWSMARLYSENQQVKLVKRSWGVSLSPVSVWIERVLIEVGNNEWSSSSDGSENTSNTNLNQRIGNWLDLVIWTKRVGDRVVFTDFTLRSGFTANSRLAGVVRVKLAARPRVCSVLCESGECT